MQAYFLLLDYLCFTFYNTELQLIGYTGTYISRNIHH